MKAILLVNPWIYDFAAYDLWMKPWGLLKLSSILKRSGCKVFFADAMDRHHPLIPGEVHDRSDGTGKFFAEEVEKPKVLRGIPRKYKRYGLLPEFFKRSLPEEKIDLVFVSSGMTYWYPGVFEAIRIVREKYPDAVIVLGGTYATLCYEHAVRESGADIVVRNWELDKLSKLAGLSCGFSSTEILEENADISFYKENPYAVLRVSVGCPFDCAYCAQKALSPPFMVKSPAKAINELNSMYHRGVRNFAFYDDALLFNTNYIEEYFGNIIRNGITAAFYSPNGLHARFLFESTASLMKKINLKDPILSLETADDAKGRAWHEKVTRKEFSKAVANLRSAGYEKGGYTAYILLAAPGSSLEDVEESMEFAHGIGAKISLSEFSPVPGTRLGRMAAEEPLLHNNTVNMFLADDLRGAAHNLKDKARRLNSALDPNGHHPDSTVKNTGRCV